MCITLPKERAQGVNLWFKNIEGLFVEGLAWLTLNTERAPYDHAAYWKY
jgi:hypothetical protein